ncbi:MULTISPECIES: HEPN domain-containing protein [Butyricimonas]|uniref:HEPN domain-containing protein n=1 Tax=Butyricimonas TaxID=574697 RepID=UPI0022E58CD3|nr:MULTISPECIES: HEPN domain-containing protein [Butyricimonas]
MKKSIAFLPKKNREDLKYLVELILDKIPVCEMIILYGSYARGTYVSYDEREEFGIPTSFKSDYDILVINSAWSYDKIENKLASVRNIYDKRGDHRYRVPVQFIHDSIKKVNEDLKYSRYFYTELKRDGIMLYNRGKNKLARRKPLKFGEIKKQGEEYFGEKYAKARLFMEQAVFMYDKEEYVMSSFNLHQACENLFNAIMLTFTLKNDKEHNLEELFKASRGYAPELIRVFPVGDEEEERLFKILVCSYIEARYNPEFKVSREDVEDLMVKVEKFEEVTKQVCERRIKEYEKLAKTEKKRK